MTEKINFKNVKEERLVGILDGSGSKGVILCHGFTGDKDEPLMKSLSQGLSKAGFLVLRFDFSGNGESEGKFDDSHYHKESADLICAIDFMKKKGCESIGLVGHSMGAANCLLVNSKVKVQCVASLASPAFPNAERLAHYAREFVKKEISAEFIECLMETDIIGSVEKSNSPILFIHGDKDTTVSLTEAKELFSHAKEPKELKVINDSGHALLKDRPLVVFEVVKWMKRYL